jgi:hypothetical protein
MVLKSIKASLKVMAIACTMIELVKFVNLLEHPGYVSAASRHCKFAMQFML